MMSDEASGPEDEDLEDKLEWKRRMAEELGMGNVSDKLLDGMSFLENIKPLWRSEEVSHASTCATATETHLICSIAVWGFPRTLGLSLGQFERQAETGVSPASSRYRTHHR